MKTGVLRSVMLLLLVLLPALAGFGCCRSVYANDRTDLAGFEQKSPRTNSGSSRMYWVRLYGYQGKLVESKRIRKGEKIELPFLRDKDSYTFQGWDTAKNKKVNPKYRPMQTIEVRSDLKLYAVYYPMEYEIKLDPSGDELTKLDRNKYSAIILIGSSNMVRAKHAIRTVCKTEEQKDRGEVFIAMTALNLHEFTGNIFEASENALLKAVEKYHDPSRPTIVYFVWGTNDLRRVAPKGARAVALMYVSYFNSLTEKLKDYNVRFYFESFNTVNCLVKKSRNYNSIVRCNYYMKKYLPASFTYVDMFEWVNINGYSYMEKPNGKDDGGHFSSRSYRRMHKHRIEILNAEELPTS